MRWGPCWSAPIPTHTQHPDTAFPLCGGQGFATEVHATPARSRGTRCPAGEAGVQEDHRSGRPARSPGTHCPGCDWGRGGRLPPSWCQAWCHVFPAGKGSAPAIPTPGPPLAPCRLGFWGLGHKLAKSPRGLALKEKSQERLWDQPGITLPSGNAPSLQQPEKAAPTLGPQLWAPVGGASSRLAGQQGVLPGAWAPLDEERALLSPDHPTFQSPPEPLPPTNASPRLPPHLPAPGAKSKVAQGRRGGAAPGEALPQGWRWRFRAAGVCAFLSSWAAPLSPWPGRHLSP